MLCDDLKGWDWGEGGSRGREVYVHIQLIHVVVQEKLTLQAMGAGAGV